MPDRIPCELGGSRSLAITALLALLGALTSVAGIIINIFGAASDASNNIVTAILSLIGIISTITRLVSRERIRRATGDAGLHRAGRMLPTVVRQQYVEEWQAWLYDMREAEEPWYRRWIEWLGIVLIAAPRLAIRLRWGRRRAVD